MRGVLNPIRRALIGDPLPSSQTVHQRLTKVTGLAVLSSDALSSVAYATDAMLEVLAPAGLLAFGAIRPLSFLIAALLIIVTLSYRQTIHAYPQGGGAYIVAKDNLGVLPGLVAATALLIDYVLTVSVSVAAGVAAVVSAAPGMSHYRVVLAVCFIAMIAWGNLRGVRDSGRIFAVPTYIFIISVAVLLAVAAARALLGQFPVAPTPSSAASMTGVGLFVLLHAFANGCTAMTGVEAISNGIPAFEPPEADNAAKTLLIMASTLLMMFLGISVLASALHVAPHEQETVVSQIARAVFGGRNVAYYTLQVATMLILVLAANTSYADFPRLASILARDGFAPMQFMHRGDRLAFSNGIVVLTLCATALVVIFRGNVFRLIPLYAVGVFLSFTLSQAGMVVHWKRHPEPGWRLRALVNAIGALATTGVLVVFVVTKFGEGAWVVLVLIPLGVSLFLAVAHHYAEVKQELSLTGYEPSADRPDLIIVIVTSLNRETVEAVRYAVKRCQEVRVVHVDLDAACASELTDGWGRWGFGTALEILESPFRSFVEPILAYVSKVETEKSNLLITVLLPEVIPHRWWQTLLHNRWSVQLRAALINRPRVTVLTTLAWPLAR
jgi:amino acid transporter